MSQGTLFKIINKMSAEKEAFYEKYAQAAIEQQIKYGIPASITLAQMAIESGMGTNTLSTQYNNYFSVKKGSSWTGPVTYHLDDHSYKEPFRVYGSVAECMEDHSKVLMYPVYQKNVKNLSSTDYVNWAYGISSAYATKGTYANMLLKDIKEYNLSKYDQMAVQQANQQGVQIGYAKNNSSQSIQPLQSQTATVQLTPLQGNWALPIDLSKVRLSSEYGVQRPGHSHGGLDLSTKGQNLPVYATEDNGKVMSVKPNNGAAGNMVVVQYDRLDGSKIQTTYMHLSQIGVNEGDTVKAGQQIGVSGNTGRSTGAHLHFETKVQNQNGEWQKFDPTLYLAEMEVRGNQMVTLDKNGKDYLAEARSQMVIGGNQNGSQLQQDPNAALLANITNSNDPTKWLAYLMQQNGEQASGQDIFSELISSMFKGALGLMMKIKADEAADLAAQNDSQTENNSQSQEESNVVKRERETVDVKALQTKASVAFDTEYPEQQQQQQSQRMA